MRRQDGDQIPPFAGDTQRRSGGEPADPVPPSALVDRPIRQLTKTQGAFRRTVRNGAGAIMRPTIRDQWPVQGPGTPVQAQMGLPCGGTRAMTAATATQLVGARPAS